MTGQLFKPAPILTERQWQTKIQGLLWREGYVYQHVFRSKMQDGSYRTTTTATGWPDLVAFRPPWIVAIECKTDDAPKKIPPEQVEWLTTFSLLPYGRAYVLRPGDNRQAIANWLTAPELAPVTYGWMAAPTLVTR